MCSPPFPSYLESPKLEFQTWSESAAVFLFSLGLLLSEGNLSCFQMNPFGFLLLLEAETRAIFVGTSVPLVM